MDDLLPLVLLVKRLGLWDAMVIIALWWLESRLTRLEDRPPGDD